TVLVIEVRDQFAWEKYPKRTCQLHFAILRRRRPQRFGNDSGVGGTVKLIACPRRKPVRFQFAGLSRTQAAHRAVDLCLHIKRRYAVLLLRYRRHAIAVEPELRAIRPEND